MRRPRCNSSSPASSQGAASGTLAPLSLAILLDILPPSRHARINLVAAVTLLLGLLSGPSIGGWLSEYHGWRSIFYFSLPVTGFIFLVVALSLPEKRAEQSPPFDFFGLTTFSFGMIGLQMLLDRGERLEWFNSAEIWAEAAASALGFYLFLVHVLTSNRISSIRRCSGTATSSFPRSCISHSASCCCRRSP